MAPKKLPWFRWYCETTSDPKLRSVALGQRWVWAAVMTLARKSPIPGLLMLSEHVPASDTAIADEAAAPLSTTRQALAAFERLSMIHRDGEFDCWAVTNWARRQYASDDVTARTTKHRKKDEPTDDEPSMERSKNVPGNDIGTHQRTETDTEVSTSHDNVQSGTRAARTTTTSDAITEVAHGLAKSAHARRRGGPADDPAAWIGAATRDIAQERRMEIIAALGAHRGDTDAAITQLDPTPATERSIYDRVDPHADCETCAGTGLVVAEPGPDPDDPEHRARYAPCPGAAVHA